MSLSVYATSRRTQRTGKKRSSVALCVNSPNLEGRIARVTAPCGRCCRGRMTEMQSDYALQQDNFKAQAHLLRQQDILKDAPFAPTNQVQGRICVSLSHVGGAAGGARPRFN